MALELTTPRLRLRGFREADREPLAALLADPEVMALMPTPLDRAQTDALIERIAGHLAEHGFGFWAIEVPGTIGFAGYVALSVPRLALPIASVQQPLVEIGWKLARAHWGRGYASEAARAVLDAGFRHFGLREIVSFTVPANRRSWAVMERIGMRRDPAGDFAHPGLPEGHRLRPHVLYRLSRDEWQAWGAASG